MISKNISCILTVLFLSSCSLSPDYVQPETTASKIVELKAGDSQLQTHFRDLFAQDRPLLEVLEHALENNYDLQQSVIRLNAARSEMRRSIFDLIPAIGFSASKSTTMSSGTDLYSGQTVRQKSEGYTNSLGVDSYEVDIWGKKISEIKAQHYDSKYAESTVAALRLTLMADIANAWYETLSMIVLWHQFNNKLAVSAQIEAGFVAIERTERLDPVLFSKFLRSRSSDESSLLSLEKEINNRIHQLEFLSGFRSPWLNVTNWRNLSGEYKVPTLSQRITSEVIFNRPDVIGAEMNIKAANGAIGAARAAFLPVFTIYANAYHTSDSFNQVLGRLSENWVFTPSVILPIFSWPKNYATLNYARTQQATTVVEYRKTVALALNDILDVTNNLRAGTANQNALQRESEQQQLNYRKITARYEAGYADLYTWYEALDLNSSTQIELESNRQQLMSYTVVLLKAIGG